MTEVVLDYSPRPQFVPFHQRSARWSVLVCHRRMGKTVACVNELITRAVYSQKKNARYAYIAPFYRQAKDVAWEYLKQFAGDAVVKAKESELRIELFNKNWITLYGADNPDALRGLYFDGVILDEYGDMRPSLWGTVVLPTLADRKGWAVFIGTPKGKNHFYEQWMRYSQDPKSFSMMVKASESGILDDEELKELRTQMSEEEYAQEMECSFEASVRGTYYANTIANLEAKGQITLVQHDPAHKVHVAADLGYTDSTAMWFWQERPDGIAIIDYEEADSVPLSYYFDILKYKPYDYADIWLPHDAKAKSLQTGRSTIEQFLAEGFPVKIAPSLSLQHGVDAVRMVLPNCWFDREKTYNGLEGLRAYRRKWDEVKKTFSDSPAHDWASHPSDAFRYFALVARERIVGCTDDEDPLAFMRTPVEYKLEELFQARERHLGRKNILRVR